MKGRIATALVAGVTSVGMIPILGLGTTSPASAITYADATVTKKVMTIGRKECERTRVQVSGDWHEDAYADVEIRVYKPNRDGNEHDYKWFDADEDGFVKMRVRVCGWNPKGTYDVEVAVWSYDAEGQAVGEASDSVSFRVKRPQQANSRIRVAGVLTARRST